jgi:hypothetical protein
MSRAHEVFTIGSRRIGRVERLTVTGRLDVLAAARLRSGFDRVLAGRTGLIELDLRGVREVGSVGVGLLTYTRRRAGGRLRVIPSPTVADVVHRAAETVRAQRPEAAR